jgi:hypothetical protein
MAATTTQIATFKRLARKAHALWQSPFYCVDPMDLPSKEIKAYTKKLNNIESAMEVIEEQMTDEQIAEVESWAYKNDLFGVLGTC